MAKDLSNGRRHAVHWHSLWAGPDGASLGGHGLLLKRPDVPPPGATLVECANTLCYTLTALSASLGTLVQLVGSPSQVTPPPVSLPNLRVR